MGLPSASLADTPASHHQRKDTLMNGSTLQTVAAECAEELPGAQLAHPFGPHTYGTSTRAAR